jgi:hypothetical protein
MNKVDKFVGAAFKVILVLYVLVVVFQGGFRPDIYRMVSVTVEGCVGILLVYILGSWALKRLGFFEGGAIKINRRALLNTLGAVFALILLVAGIEYLFHDTSLTKQAMEDLQASNDGTNALGVPIRIGWFITGGMHLRGDDGTANLSVPVKGSKAAGQLELTGIKKDGSWHIVDLHLLADGNKAVIQIPH